MTTTEPVLSNILFDVIQSRLALTLDEHRQAQVMRILEEMIESGYISHIQGLINTLSAQPTTHSLWQKIVQIATIGETYFFRDLAQVNALKSIVLPEIIERKRVEGRLKLRVWSAGCSTGEEPYTLAILLRDLLPDYNEWDITILGTDLNDKHLDRARSGIYRPWSFRSETPESIRQRWFTEEPSGYRIDPLIHRMVSFAPLNLAGQDYPSVQSGTLDMDLILCRNVLIYFDNLTAAQAVERFYQTLSPQGWLVLGHAESGHINTQSFQPRNFENAVLYQKQTGQEQMLPDTMVTACDEWTTSFAVLRQPIGVTKPLSQISPIRSTRIFKTPVTPPVTVSPQDDLWENARAAANKEHWSEALRLLEEAEKRHKLCPEIHYLRGIVEQNLSEIYLAMQSFRRSIYCDSNFVMSYLALSALYEKQQNYRKALYQLNQAQHILEQFPTEAAIPFSDDLTAEALRMFVQYQINHLAAIG